MKTLTITAFLFLLSCNSETGNQNNLSNDVVNSERADLDISDDSFPFPQLQTIASCNELPKAPTLCEWGRAAHDIVLLEITETSLITSPSIDRKTGKIVENCEGIVEAGFRIEGIVQESLNGLSGKINVDVGILQFVDHWDPQPWPKLGEDGSVLWSNSSGVIKAGDVIGLTLHKHPTDETIGILGEHFFDINQKNTIRFGDLEYECGSLPPQNVSGLTFDKLEEEIEKCAPNSVLADARKQAKEKIWQDPTFSNLGVCYPAR